MKPTVNQIAAAAKVFACMAVVETLKPIIHKIQNDTLKKGRYKYLPDMADRREIDDLFITNHNHTYMMSDKDAGHYFTELNAAYLKSGFDVKYGYCPLLIAESNYRDARRELIDAMEPVTKLDFDRLICSGLDHLNEYTELTLHYLAPFVKQITNK